MSNFLKILYARSVISIGNILLNYQPPKGPGSILINQLDTDLKVIALTFDDLYDSETGHLKAILKTLKERRVNCTFFPTGHAVSADPDSIRELIADGHEIGNHCWSHPTLTQLTEKQIKKEIYQADQFIEIVAGQSPKPFFRPPQGYFNQTVLKVAGELGYPYTVKWNINTRDSRGPSVESIYKTVIDQAVPGSIVLMHVNKGAVNTPLALPMIIAKLKEMGYELVTLSQLFNDSK